MKFSSVKEKRKNIADISVIRSFSCIMHTYSTEYGQNKAH